MTNQEILNTLSKLESEFYYRIDEYGINETIKKSDYKDIRDMINGALVKWHKLTGLTITE